jgi:hypothetical protein
MVTFDSADFDEDNMIGRDDLHKIIDRLTGDQKLGESDMEQLIDSVSTTVLCQTGV